MLSVKKEALPSELSCACSPPTLTRAPLHPSALHLLPNAQEDAEEEAEEEAEEGAEDDGDEEEEGE